MSARSHALIQRKPPTLPYFLEDKERYVNGLAEDVECHLNIQPILQQMGSSKIFSRLDLRAGYYQIPLHESSKEKTVFPSPEGHLGF